MVRHIGSDSDSVASIAGEVLGARCPDTVNEKSYAVVSDVNQDDLVSLAENLAMLRAFGHRVPV